MTRLPPRRRDDLDGPRRALYDTILDGPRSAANLVAEDGSLRGPFGPMLESPTIGEPLQALGAAIRFGGQLPPDQREVAILAVAAHWRCDFEWIHHLPHARAAGVDVDAIAGLWDGRPSVLGDAVHDLVVAVVGEVFEQRSLTDATFARATTAFGTAALFELLTLIGYYSTLAIVMNGFAIT